MNGMTELELVQEFIDPAIFILIPALWFFGVILKTTPKFPDWAIVWVLLLVGVLASVAIVGFDVYGIIQGFLATAVAVLGYDLFNQTKKGMK